MSETMPEQTTQDSGGGGNFFTKKYMGIPGIVWLGGAAILAYFLFFRNSSSSSSSGTSGTSGTTSGSSGTINVNPLPSQGGNWQPLNTDSGSVSQSSSNTNALSPNQGSGTNTGTPNPQPQPTTTPAASSSTTSTTTTATQPTTTYTTYTVQAGDTLASIAKKFGITVAALAHANTYVAGEVPGNKKVGQTLGTGAGLLTGQVLKIPHTS